MKTLIRNIRQLLQVRENCPEKVCGAEMSHLPVLNEAWVSFENGIITGFGTMETCPDAADVVINAKGKLVLPAFCDSHTHLVFAANRAGEFVDRIKGMTYQEIAAKGGGILNSAKKLNETSEEALLEAALSRLEEVIGYGTGAIEIKSGYGLSVEGELKMLRVIKKLKDRSRIEIKSTFLGAHALPEAFINDREAWFQLIEQEMLPAIALEKLADFIDVFCETNYFSPQETARLLEAGKKYGLRGKIHVNQFTAIGGIQVAADHQALSVDHLEVMRDEDFDTLAISGIMPTVLPSCSFFLGISYAPARKMIDSGLPVALASDFNPGSSPSGNMPFVLSLACIKQKLTPEEAINAATLNSAFAMNLEKEYGSITIGKVANLLITKPMDHYNQIPYSFGSNPIDTVFLAGKAI